MRKTAIIYIVVFLVGIISLQGAKLYQITNEGEIAVSFDDGVSWDWMSTFSQTGVEGIVPGDTNELYAIDENGTVYYSGDNASNWEIMGSVNQVGVVDIEYNLLDNELYVITNTGKLFVSSDSGRTFTERSNVNQIGINSATMDKNGNLYLMTDKGEIYESVNKGVNFSLIGSINESDMISILSEDSLIYSIDLTGYIYRFSKTNKETSIVGSVSQTGVVDITYADDTLFFVATGNGEVFRSTDANNWSRVGTSSQEGITGISSSINVMLSMEDILLAGEFQGNRVMLKWYYRGGDNIYKYVIYRSTDENNYERIGETNDNFYYDYDIKDNHKYYYKVEAIGVKAVASNIIGIKVTNIVLKNIIVERNPFMGLIHASADENPIYIYNIYGRLVDVITNGIIGNNMCGGIYILKSDGYKPLKIEKIY